MRRAVFSLSILALTTVVFLTWMHPAVLWPTNVGWLLAGEDRGQSAIGLAAHLRAGGPWPGLHERLLAAPEGMTLLFTDSIPLLGLIFKPFALWLPSAIQFIGLWYALCVFLQAGFAAALVRRHTGDPLAAWLATALLTLSPMLLNRFGHASLCAHWLILWALWVFVDADRARRPAWWMAVLSVAALIHSYLLLMVAAIWSSALLVLVVRGPDRARTVALALATLVPVLALVSLHGVWGGHFASTHSYGGFPVALDAWWNPANPDYTALLPSSPQTDGRGFEGFQYLGAGMLALTAAAVLAAARTPRADRRASELARLAWLLPAFALLALVAIGPAPFWWGRPLFVAHLSASWVDALDPIRAAGRLIWPVTYTLFYAVIAVTCRQPRAVLLLGGALALQVIDLTPMFAAVRATSARAEDWRTFTRTRDPRWSGLVAHAGSIEFEPPENFRDLQLMEEVAWRAVQACRPVRFFYASRERQVTVARVAADSRAYAAGLLDPTRLYILLGGTSPPAPVATQMRVLDGVHLIPPSRPAPRPFCA